MCDRGDWRKHLQDFITQSFKQSPFGSGTARSVEDGTQNDRRNANQNPEWWGEISQLVEIEVLQFLCISRYKFKLRF